MDLPFFYTNTPWSFYYPLPPEQNGSTSVSRGRIYEDFPPDFQQGRPSASPPTSRYRTPSQRRQSANPPTSRYHTPARRHSNSGSCARLTNLPSNRGRQSTSRAMQATGAHRPPTIPLRSSPHLWPTRLATKKPSVSFSRAAKDLHVALADAIGHFQTLYNKFKEETSEVVKYANQAVVDQVWVRKIWSDKQGRHGEDAQHGQGREEGEGEVEGGNEMRTETVAARIFRDHQVAVYNRCDDILCATPPPSLQNRRQNLDDVGNDGSVEAAALVSKMSRCRDDLFPPLRWMGSRFAMVDTAIKEMEVLKANLETYREVWDNGEESG